MKERRAMASIDNAYIDYRNLLKSLKDTNNVDDIYQQLMEKEQSRVDLINRVVENDNNNIFKDTMFYNQSIVSIAMNFAAVWKEIFREFMVDKREIATWPRIFYEGQRKIYTGIMVLLIALLLFFIQSAS